MNNSYVNKYIITGGPGFGKSTVINCLRALGIMVIPEAARYVIDRNSIAGQDLLTISSRYTFDKYIIKIMVEQYLQCNKSKLTLYDRGIPDLIAWRKYFKMNCDDVIELAHQYKYENMVFITKPWIEIYSQNVNRPFSFDASCEINTILGDVYTDLGYTLEYLPNDTNEARVDFILGKLSQ